MGGGDRASHDAASWFSALTYGIFSAAFELCEQEGLTALSENDDADDSRPTRVEEECNGPKVPVPQKLTEVHLASTHTLAMHSLRACMHAHCKDAPRGRLADVGRGSWVRGTRSKLQQRSSEC